MWIKKQAEKSVEKGKNIKIGKEKNKHFSPIYCGNLFFKYSKKGIKAVGIA